MNMNHAEVRRLEVEINRNDREIARFEGELLSAESNREPIRERALELRARNVRLHRDLAALRDYRVTDGHV